MNASRLTVGSKVQWTEGGLLFTGWVVWLDSVYVCIKNHATGTRLLMKLAALKFPDEAAK